MFEKQIILVADDEPSLRRVLTGIIERRGHQGIAVSNGHEALAELTKQPINAIITDLRMPGLDGMALLQRVAADYPDIPVVILTAHGSVDNAVAAVKLGAFDYLEKPFEQQQVEQVIELALRTNALRLREVRLTGAHGSGGRYGLVGTSAPMQALYNIIERVADTPSTTLITGESGTGKELVARALHEQSRRAAGPLIKVNCAAIPDSLIESELFGHERGAFTGAVSTKPGRFELAHGGTLFLDEIGDIPLEMQVKLLRSLQDNELERVGGIKTIKVDVRVVAATNRHLLEDIQQGRFREDLYYRLNVVPIHLVPLRERTADLPLLVRHILSKLQQRLGRNVNDISNTALAALQGYSFPGNIRELENILERTVLFCASDTIQPADLPEAVFAAERPQAPTNRLHQQGSVILAPPTPSSKPVALQQDPLPTAHHRPHDAGAPGSGRKLKEIVKAETSRIERQAITAALQRSGGNITHAAKELGVSRKGLQLKIKEFQLRVDDELA